MPMIKPNALIHQSLLASDINQLTKSKFQFSDWSWSAHKIESISEVIKF